MRRFRNFNHSARKTLPNLLETIYVSFCSSVTVVKFRVDHRGVSLKDYGPSGRTTGHTKWRATGHPSTHGHLARQPRRRAAWFYIARFVTWSNQCELLHLLHQWTDAGTANVICVSLQRHNDDVDVVNVSSSCRYNNVETKSSSSHGGSRQRHDYDVVPWRRVVDNAVGAKTKTSTTSSLSHDDDDVRTINHEAMALCRLHNADRDGCHETPHRPQRQRYLTLNKQQK